MHGRTLDNYLDRYADGVQPSVEDLDRLQRSGELITLMNTKIVSKDPHKRVRILDVRPEGVLVVGDGPPLTVDASRLRVPERSPWKRGFAGVFRAVWRITEAASAVPPI